jgi:hypothetical protein
MKIVLSRLVVTGCTIRPKVIVWRKKIVNVYLKVWLLGHLCHFLNVNSVIKSNANFFKLNIQIFGR